MAVRTRIQDALNAHFDAYKATHKKALTRSAFARRLRIDTRTLMRLLSGEVRSPKAQTLQRLASELGLSVDHLLGLE